ncbi:MAG: FMN-binding glutamate synthase family protein [Hyphomicrobiaceae bacterium]|nr:FMN-binding glutamate synthase family protein [Hyphomicrobiaceae bacterium]
MNILSLFTMKGMAVLSTIFVMVVGLVLLALIILFVIDVTQRKDAVRHNFPVIGRFRGLFIHLGEFFRQYFFAMDREEMPFNRAERRWVTQSAAGIDNTVAFGSTRNLTAPGMPIFVNAPFALLDEETSEAAPILFGPYSKTPYETSAIIGISAMSFGALSRPAIRALSRGAKLAGIYLNTGEGGLSPHHLEGDCDIIFQIGTAKYGVRNEDGSLDENKLRAITERPQIKMLELKLSQGAKPGKGGILPGVKVTNEISKIRGIPAGKSSISPNRHPEISNNNELLDFINHLQELSGKPVGFKMVISDCGWLEELCELILARDEQFAPDFITVDGGDGGTGAAPMPLMDNVGLTVREALPAVVDVLTRYGLRPRIRVIASGKLITPAEVAYAYCAGADMVNGARGFMFALGCIQALKCNRNTCPTGITTHKTRLQSGLDPLDKAVKIKNYVGKIRYGTGLIAHSCGVREPRALQRNHCRIALGNGRSQPLHQIYPPALPERQKVNS